MNPSSGHGPKCNLDTIEKVKSCDETTHDIMGSSDGIILYYQ